MKFQSSLPEARKHLFAEDSAEDLYDEDYFYLHAHM
jgi:hypothetical protein